MNQTPKNLYKIRIDLNLKVILCNEHIMVHLHETSDSSYDRPRGPYLRHLRLMWLLFDMCTVTLMV